MSSSTSTLDSPRLSAFTGAPGYAEGVNELVARIPGAADEGEALDLLAEVTELLGAEVAAFGSFIRDDGSYESFRFLLACDAVWCHLYEERTWYAADPWLHYASRHSEPIRASEIRVSSRAEREVVELAAEFGFRSAVIVPAPSSGGLTRLGVLCLGSSQPGYFEGDGYFALRVAARSVAMELNA